MNPEENTRLYRVEQAISGMRLDLSKILQRLDREVDPDATDHEERLRSLERWRWIVVGASAALSAAIGYLSQLGN